MPSFLDTPWGFFSKKREKSSELWKDAINMLSQGALTAGQILALNSSDAFKISGLGAGFVVAGTAFSTAGSFFSLFSNHLKNTNRENASNNLYGLASSLNFFAGQFQFIGTAVLYAQLDAGKATPIMLYSLAAILQGLKYLDEARACFCCDTAEEHRERSPLLRPQAT